MATSKSPSEEQSLKSGYELRDADFRKLMIIGIGLLGLMAVGLIFSWIVYQMVSGEAPQKGTGVETFVIPGDVLHKEPRLQSDPRADLLVMKAREDSILSGYGWISKEAKIVRIPIDRAMERTVTGGLPTQSE